MESLPPWTCGRPEDGGQGPEATSGRFQRAEEMPVLRQHSSILAYVLPTLGDPQPLCFLTQDSRHQRPCGPPAVATDPGFSSSTSRGWAGP